MHLQRFRFNPFAILIIESFLCDFADIDLGVEVGSKCLVMVSGIAVNDIKIMNLVEMMLGSIGCVDARHARVESAAEDSRQSGLFESVFVCPLPRIFKVSLILWLIVGRVEIVASACKTSIHDGKILIWQCQIDHQFGLIVAEECLQLLHIIGIHLCGLDIHRVALAVDGLHQLVAFLLATAGNHEFCEHISVLRNLKRCHGCDATGANHQNSAHLTLSCI